MKGRKPNTGTVVPFKGDAKKHVPDAPDFMSDDAKLIYEEVSAQVADGHIVTLQHGARVIFKLG